MSVCVCVCGRVNQICGLGAATRELSSLADDGALGTGGGVEGDRLQVASHLHDALKSQPRRDVSQVLGRANQEGEPFPVDDGKLMEFSVYLHEVRQIRSSSIKQYISAVKYHNSITQNSDAQALSLLLKGITTRQVETHGGTELKPIWEAGHVLEASDKLTALAKSRSPSLEDCQALAASIIGFLFALRARSLASVCLRDLESDKSNFKLTVRASRNPKSGLKTQTCCRSR
eukprot:m.501794 g.501794  ORF g.501794 m.501794 type:complete len:231 (-) comp57333_c0_seq26:639-1331(-)